MRKLPAVVLVLATLVVGAAPAAAGTPVVRMGKGQTLQISVIENPSTGYAWKITTKPSGAILRRQRDRFKPGPSKDKNGRRIVGSPGVRYFYWKAIGHGTTTITLKEFPPGGGKAAQTLRYTVRVR